MTKECTFEEFVAGTPGMAETIAKVNAESIKSLKAEQARIRKNAARRAKDKAMRDLGLIKVRGALGGTYWE